MRTHRDLVRTLSALAALTLLGIRRTSRFLLCSSLLVAVCGTLVPLREAHALPVLYASSLFEGVVYKIHPSGEKSVFASGFEQPWGLTTDSEGNLFVADTPNRRIVKITPSGVQSTFYQFASELAPQALAFGADGTLYVAGVAGGPYMTQTTSTRSPLQEC